jgi:hypothetical protein
VSASAERYGAHLELFARGHIVVVPAGIGVASPRRRGAYVVAGRCSTRLRTREPTGVVEVAPGPTATLGELFDTWGRTLTSSQLLSFRGPVRAWLDGRPVTGDPRAIRLRRHAQVVVVSGASVPVHRTYTFANGLLLGFRGRMRRTAAIVTALALLVLPAAARADGDPASDILLSQDVFYPYAPNAVSPPLQKALNGMVAAAKKKGFPVKVALIAAASDLGSVPQLLSDPQRYADLLTQEIAFNSKPRVLVVLPSGIGGNNLGDNAGPALSDVNVPDGAGHDADALARTAMTALGKLSAADGKPVPVPHVSAASKKSGSSGSAVLIFGVPVLLVVLAAGVMALRNRSDEDDSAPDPE